MALPLAGLGLTAGPGRTIQFNVIRYRKEAGETSRLLPEGEFMTASMESPPNWTEPLADGRPRAGIRSVRETIDTSARLGLEIITLYAFSTENWKRPRHEVLTLMGLLKEYIKRELDNLRANNLRFRPIGRIDQLDPSVLG